MAVLFTYFAATFALGLSLNVSFNDAIVFDPETKYSFFSQYILKPIIVLAGIPLIFIIPGMIWTLSFLKKNRCYLTLFGSAFAVNLILLIVSTSIFKIITHSPLNRTNFLGIITTIVATGLIFFFRNRMCLEKINIQRLFKAKQLINIIIGIIFVGMLIFVLHEKIFIENFNGDGVEIFEFSKSLKEHLLPHWDLENGSWGFYPTFMFFSYPNSFSILLFGESEAAVRLPFFVYLFCIYLVLLGFIEKGINNEQRLKSLFLLLIFILFTIINCFYATHHAHFADIASPTAIEAFLTLLVLFESYFLLIGNKKLFLIYAIFSTLARPSGIIFTFMLCAFYWVLFKLRRKYLVKVFATYILFLLGYKFLIFIYTRFFPLGIDQFSLTRLISRFQKIPHGQRVVLFIRYFFITSGIIPALSLFFSKSNDKISRYFSLVILSYLSLILLSVTKHIHYFIPLTFFSTIVFFRLVNKAKRQMLYYSLFSVIVISLIILSLPTNYIIYTYNRELGSQTCMLFDSYKEAVEQSHIIYKYLPPPTLNRNRTKWGIGKHTWVYYSDSADFPQKSYNYYLVSPKYISKVPNDFKEVESINGAHFFVKDIEQLENTKNLFTADYRSILFKK